MIHKGSRGMPVYTRANSQGFWLRLMRRIHVDIPLLSGLLLLSLVGLVIMYSAGGQSLEVLGRQVRGAVMLLWKVDSKSGDHGHA